MTGTHADALVAVAERFAFVRETLGPNHGLFVGLFQRFTHNRPGDSWCCSFESFVEDVVYEGHPPTEPTASCAEKLAGCRLKDYVVDAPQKGDLYFFIESGVAHHVGIVTSVNPLVGIAGNTSPDGRSTNGTGVYEHQLSAAEIVFARLP